MEADQRADRGGGEETGAEVSSSASSAQQWPGCPRVMWSKGEEGKNICPAPFCLSRDREIQGGTKVKIKQKEKGEMFAGMEDEGGWNEGSGADCSQT